MIEDTRAEQSAVAVSGLFGRDMIYLALWASQLVLAATLTPVATRLLPASEFGRVAAAVAVMQLLNALLGFGLVTAVQRAYSGENGEEDARRLVALAIVMAALGGAVAFATGSLWSPLLGLGHFPTPIRYAVVWAVLTAITGPALSLVRSRDQLLWFVAASFAESLIAQALALVLVAAVKGTATEYMLGQTLGQLLTVAILLLATRPSGWSAAQRPMLSDALKFSIPLVPALIAAFLLDASDRLVIHGDLGATPLGRYAVARNIGGFAILLLAPLDFVWLSRLFGIKDEDLRRRVMATSRDGLYLLMVAFAVAITVASPLILRIWSPSSYRPNTLYLITALVAASAIPSAGGMVYNQILILRGRTRMVSAVALGGALFNLGLNLALVPSLGIDGSAAITLFTSAGSVLIVHRLVGADALPNRRSSLAIAIGGVALCLASAAVSGSGPMLALRLVVAALASALFLTRLGTLISPALSAKLLSRFRWLPSVLAG